MPPGSERPLICEAGLLTGWVPYLCK